MTPNALKLTAAFLFSALQFDASAANKAFNWDQGMTALWHAQNSYCDPESYLERTPKGPVEGLQVTYAIYDEEHATNGYIGYSKNEETIYVAIRGSVELENFISDAHIRFQEVDYPSACKGMEDTYGEQKIHKGFYDCSAKIGMDVAMEVTRLTSKFPSFQVVVTGHSLGGAVATLMAMVLKEPVWDIADKVQLYTFGCPRVGNKGFAVCASNILSSNSSRITHSRDIIPHSPSHMRYQHVNHEWYEPTDDVDVMECHGYEDEKCSMQWGSYSISDHLLYLGVKIGSSAQDSCAQIMDMP